MALDLGVIIITAVMADFLMTVGSMIGLGQQANALRDKQTIYTRKSSLPNTITYPVTLLLPLAVIGLWGTFTVSLIRFLIWVGIYRYRAPKEEDWLGRKEMTYREYIYKNYIPK